MTFFRIKFKVRFWGLKVSGLYRGRGDCNPGSKSILGLFIGNHMTCDDFVSPGPEPNGDIIILFSHKRWSDKWHGHVVETFA